MDILGCIIGISFWAFIAYFVFFIFYMMYLDLKENIYRGKK